MQATNPKSPSLKSLYPAILPSSSGSGGAILGIGAFGHDAAAALIECATGKVLFAQAEERLTNKKHDWHYPIGAVLACCEQAVRLGLNIEQVAVNFRHQEFATKTLFQEIDGICPKPVDTQRLKATILRRIEETNYFSVHDVAKPNEVTAELLSRVAELPLSEEQRKEIILRLTWYFNWSVKYKQIKNRLEEHCEGWPIRYVNHHLAHAASAFYNSGYSDAAVLVIDGSGESDTVTIFHGHSEGLELVQRTGWPHSLGIFYLFATQHLGFSLGDEYKVMGMSAYGQPRFYDEIARMMRVAPAGEFQLLDSAWQKRATMTGLGHVAYQFTGELDKVIPRRTKSDPITQLHFDFAASIQKVTEEIGVELARKALALTGTRHLAIAGGVGLNGLMNEAIRTRSGCEDLFIYPAAGDDGTAVGAAQLVAAEQLIQAKKSPATQRLGSCYFGYRVTESEARVTLNQLGIEYSTPASIHQEIARALAAGKIVARCHDAAEFGPRALGHRSILAHPGLATMKETLNARVKHREEFRPFAPACLRERVSDFFEIDCDAPFMLLITRAKAHAKSILPAVVHEDGTARVQSVSAQDHPDFYKTISAFNSVTGIPVVLNTSFNVNGETIVDTALDAIESFGFMDIDFLALGPYWISKEANAKKFPAYEHDEYLKIRQQRYLSRQLGDITEMDIAQFDPAFLNVDEAAAACARTLGGWRRVG